MTSTEIKELRASLIGKQDSVLDDVSRHGIASAFTNEVIADENERADRIADEMVEHQLGFTESKMLQDIASAIERIDAGTYGVCEDCKEDIYIERLRALPAVSLCINCQSKKEEVASGKW
ncbi:MAG: TraR/DksA family transcriptional regulator [Akkermansiaceae bacterium]